jgi:hypothetical protein
VNSRAKGIVPAVLGVAMLAVVLAAALSPDLGSVPAQTSTTPYSQPSSSSTGLSALDWISLLVVVLLVGVIVALMVLRTRRNRPPPGGEPPMGGTAGPPLGAAGFTGGAPPTPPGAGPAYLETPEDVGMTPPVVAGAAAAGAVGAVASAPAAGAQSPEDIDSLMAELDRISNEILKRTPKKPPEDPDDAIEK